MDRDQEVVSDHTSHSVMFMLYCQGTEPSASVLQATLATHSSAAMLIPVQRTHVESMLTVPQLATELCANVGRDMR